MESTDPRQNLLQLAARRGVSLSELSRMIGRNPSYLQQFVRKGSPRKLEETDRLALSRFFGVEQAQLGGVKENSFVSPMSGKGKDWIDVPRLSLGASAGPGSVADGEDAIGVFRFSTRWLRDQGLDPAHLSAIEVRGDSMEPVLRDGDEILVDRARRSLSDGIHVVRVDDTLLVKRVDTGHPGRIILRSENPAYEPLQLKPRDVDVIGRVVWKSGRL